MLGLVVRQAPLPAALWLAVALVRGLLIPAQLWFTKSLIDALALQIQSDTAQPYLLWLSLLVGTLLTEQAVIGLQPWLQACVRERTSASLQEQVMQKAAGLDLSTFEHQAYYDRLSRVMTATESRGPQMLQQALIVVRLVPALAGYAVALAAISPVFLLLCLVSVMPSLATYFLGGQEAFSLLYKQTRDHRLAAYYAGILTDRPFAKEVRLYGLADHVLERWSTLYWQARNEQRRLALRLGIRMRGMFVISTAAILLGLLWVVRADRSGVTAGDYALLFQSVWGLFRLLGLGQTLKSLGEQSGFASEVRAFFRLPSVLEPTAPGAPFPRPLTSGIRFDQVWFTYPGSDRPALAGVSFEIRAGETIAIVGENGAGKSTIIKLLLGIYQPDAGRITIDGRDGREIDLQSWHRAASSVFQQFGRYPLTFGENIAIGRPDREIQADEVMRAAQSAGAHEMTRGLKEGYDTLLGPDVGGVDLSGGQWQRIAIARAFMKEVELLVLDEPTAALDPLAEMAVFERFVDLAKGRTAVLVSHRMGMARLAGRVLVMRGGRLVEDGAHDHLLQSQGEYAALFAAQARWYE